MFTKALTLFTLLSFAAYPASSSYQLKSYGVNSGGSNSTASGTYSAQVNAGEVSGPTTSGNTLSAKTGSIQTQQANVPGAPTLSNAGLTYTDKLNFIINTSSNPSDTIYAIAVSTVSNFASVNYVQADGTLAGSPVWQDYSSWGSGSGSLAIGLVSSTRYWFKVAAIQGKFTASAYGPSANEVTGGGPSLSFSLSPNTLNMGNLTAGSVISSSTITTTIATNAAYGATIYLAGSDTGLTSSAAGSHKIDVSPPSGNLSALGEGFGLQGSTAGSPLSIVSPYNGSSNTVGAIYTTFQPVFNATTTITSATATAVLKAKASVTTPAASDYTVTLTFVAAASY